MASTAANWDVPFLAHLKHLSPRSSHEHSEVAVTVYQANNACQCSIDGREGRQLEAEEQ
jgi:hypothetical protein